MRDSKDLLLASKKYACEDRWRSWWCLISTLCIFSALITVTCLDLPLYVRVVSSILSGLVMVRMFVLYHDYQHGAILRNSRIASWFMTAYGIFTINPLSIWNRSHDHHHKNNSKIFGASIGSYPVMTTTAHAKASRLERFSYAVSRHAMTIALGYISIFLYGMCLRSLLTNPKRHFDSAVSLVLHMGLICWLATVGWDLALLAVIVPFTISSAVGAYLFYAQHNFPGVQYRDRDDWNYVFAALQSSSYIKMSPVMHWITGNIGYHHVHHLNARIPFYRLPEAMDGIKELQTPKTTSLHVVDIFRCLRLKLWDAEREQLVSFAEAAETNSRGEFTPRLVTPLGSDDTPPPDTLPISAFKETQPERPLRKAG